MEEDVRAFLISAKKAEAEGAWFRIIFPGSLLKVGSQAPLIERWTYILTVLLNAAASLAYALHRH